MSKERPIIFGAPMVRALLAGTKTQTRRVVKLPPWAIAGTLEINGDGLPEACSETTCLASIPCPYGVPGDRLWVRESFSVVPTPGGSFGDAAMGRDLTVEYKAGGTKRITGGGAVAIAGAIVDFAATDFPCDKYGLPRSPIFMPRWSSRLTLELLDVRVQRLQEIALDDAIAEGARKLVPESCERWADGSPKGSHWSMMDPHPCQQDPAGGHRRCLGSPQMAFANAWDAINGKRDGCSWAANPWVWALTLRKLAAAEVAA